MNVNIIFLCIECGQTDPKKFDKRDKHLCKACLKKLAKESGAQL